MADPNLGQLAASTLRNRPNEVSDSVTANNAFLAYYKMKNKFETREGGRTYLQPINFAENDTVKWFDGALESFSINTSSQLDASEWARKFQAGFIYFTEGEKQANRGEAAAVRLVDNKIDVLKSTLANAFSTAVYNDGTVSNQVGGLQALVADNPATGTVGGINAATYTWWRNKFKTGTTATAVNIKALLTEMWLSTIRGTDKPDLLIGGNDMFTFYFNSLSDLQRFSSSNETGDTLQYENLKFQSATFLFDPTCATKRIYGLDMSDFIVVCDPGSKWSVGDSREVTNAFYEVTPCKWSGAIICKRRQSHFVINGT